MYCACGWAVFFESFVFGARACFTHKTENNKAQKESSKLFTMHAVLMMGSKWMVIEAEPAQEM